MRRFGYADTEGSNDVVVADVEWTYLSGQAWEDRAAIGLSHFYLGQGGMRRLRGYNVLAF